MQIEGAVSIAWNIILEPRAHIFTSFAVEVKRNAMMPGATPRGRVRTRKENNDQTK